MKKRIITWFDCRNDRIWQIGIYYHFVLSLAVNYSPEDIAFILIDYKGVDWSVPLRAISIIYHIWREQLRTWMVLQSQDLFYLFRVN